ncbi:hypothetical protein NJ76_00455 [Rhodococcus sp. IITR03]|nr:hypothetical protein NJ76_00455 [Rhodococcus sp. IITR03]
MALIVGFYLGLAAMLTVLRRLINRARTYYRWPARPTTRRCKRRSLRIVLRCWTARYTTIVDTQLPDHPRPLG